MTSFFDMMAGWIAGVACGFFAGWVLWMVICAAHWRADNLRRSIIYRRKHGRYCDHRYPVNASQSGYWKRDEPGSAWSMWFPFKIEDWEYRTCNRCGQQQQRNRTEERVYGP